MTDPRSVDRRLVPRTPLSRCVDGGGGASGTSNTTLANRPDHLACDYHHPSCGACSCCVLSFTMAQNAAPPPLPPTFPPPCYGRAFPAKTPDQRPVIRGPGSARGSHFWRGRSGCAGWGRRRDPLTWRPLPPLHQQRPGRADPAPACLHVGPAAAICSTIASGSALDTTGRVYSASWRRQLSCICTL